MNGSDERQAAKKLLGALEHGGVPPADLPFLVERLDPVLVYTIFRFLRAVHPASDPAASAVLERVVRLTRASAEAVRKNQQGSRDPVARWFESEHGYLPYKGRGEEMIDRIADKLEG